VAGASGGGRGGTRRPLSYAVVTAVRDDAVNLERLGCCLVAQTKRPVSWVIVDQGSADASAAVARRFVQHHDWIHMIPSPGGSQATRGAPIAEAFELGVASLPASVDIVVRVDADVSMETEFCGQLVQLFESDEALGIASGSRWELDGGAWRQRFVVGPSVEAQCRAYRRDCLTAVLPLDKHRGWDGVDVVQAELLGWGTLVAADLGFRHHRAIGARDGSRLQAWVGEGSASYSMGYRLSYLTLRSLYHARRDPWAVGLLVGYVRAALDRTARASDSVRRYVKDRQSPKYLRERAREARGTGKSEHVDVLLAAEPGGHLLELYALRPVWQHHDRVWMTLPAPDSLSLLAGERFVFGRGPTCRNFGNLLRNLWIGWKVVSRYRPKLIVSTGSGLVVPLVWIARVRGVKTVYIECGGRIDRPSLSCRLVSRAADQIYVQWPELVDVVHRARFAGNILSVAWRTRAAEGSGTVFASVGTSTLYPFDRLVRALSAVAEERSVVIQHGISSASPGNARSIAFLSLDELVDHFREASVVVTHGGIGSVLLALYSGKRPIVMPRCSRLGESVDDHQIAFAKRLERQQLATVVSTEDELLAAVAAASRAPGEPRPGPSLVEELTRVVDAAVVAEGSGPHGVAAAAAHLPSG
jgi:UDP-N-acetylglucosamine transferase subunit ALG13